MHEKKTAHSGHPGLPLHAPFSMNGMRSPLLIGLRRWVDTPRYAIYRRTLMGKLQDKVAVITGGTSGMGLATAKRFVAEGANEFIMGRRRAELDAAVKEIGSNVTGVQGDIAKLTDLDRLYETIKATKGHVDVVFANAGVGEVVPLGAISSEHFDQIFNINVGGTLFDVQKALPLLRDGGSIILTGSIASVKGL